MSDRWYFTEEQLANSPSRKCGINAELELSYRQRAANLIQEMGQRLQVSQLCINTAIVYMHRFYAFHSFTMFHRNTIAAASFFLAAKVEEQPRKLEHVIKILNICLEKTDMTRDTYAEQAQELVLNENILLQTLGFDVAIDHPHTHVVKACQLFNIVTVSRELRQTCYFMASNSLHLTTMCLKYRPTVVAAFCIYIACKWSRWEIPDSSEGKAWYSYVDETVTLDTLKKLTEEYLQILDRSPSKFKSKMKAITSNGQAGLNQSPSISGSDGPSTSHHKNQNHDKHNHHHHHHKNASMSNSATNSINANGNSRSSQSSKAQMHQISNSSSSSSQYKPVPQSGIPQPAASSSNHNIHRPRPPGSNQPYPSSNNSKPPLMDERTFQQQQRQEQQQRLMHQDSAYHNPAAHPKHRISSSNPPLPQQQPPLPQQHQPPQPYMKLGINDQKQHNLMGNNSKQIPPYPPQQQQGMDLHQKNMKQSSTEYHNSRNNPLKSQMNQPIPNNPQNKPSWPQQSQQQSSSMSQQQSSHNQDKQYQHLQKNLQMPNNILDQSASNLINTSKAMSNYNDMASKQQQHTASVSQNDFWFNDKINEMSSNTPPRHGKSLFSPSPEHDSGTNEKAKYMMVAGSLKKQSNDNVDSPKDDNKKSSTPTKRDRSMLANSSSQNKQNIPPLPMPIPSSQIDKKFTSKMDSILNSNPPLPHLDTKDTIDSSQMLKKRSYSSIKDSIDSSQNRENKIRKVEQVKSEPSVPSSLPVTPSHSLITSKITQQQQQQQQSLSNPPSIYGATDQTSTLSTKQPIETNPDIVKSLLQECFSSNKYDAFDADMIYPEPPEELFATTNVVSNSSSSSNNNNNNNNKNSNNNNNSSSNNQQPIQQQIQPAVTKHESMDDLLDIKDDKMDSSAGEGSRKDHKKKSKKKKEKHKHKKKHKSSDRDEKSDSSSLKIIISKDSKSDSKSSPENFGGIKIKIPINKDTAAAVPTTVNKNEVNPAPIKLKISKGSFTNINSNANTSSSSSASSHHHHKSKKDKDREKSKSKSSKHHNSSDYKEGSYQHST